MDKVTSYVADKTGTTFTIERLYVTFSGNIFLEELYLEDLSGDTLLYSHSLEAGLEFLPLINSGAVKVSKLHWQGVSGKVSRPEGSEEYNFNFLIEEFLPQTEQADTVASDTSSTGLNLALANVQLSDLRFSYDDAYLGIASELALGTLTLEIPEIDLETMAIAISSIALRDTKGSYTQTKPFPPSPEDSTESSPIRLILDELTLESIHLTYENTPDKLRADLNVGELALQLPLVDMSSQTVELDRFRLFSSSILYHDFSSPVPQSASEEEGDETGFTWPDWKVEAKEVLLEDNNIEFKTADSPFRSGYFNPEAMLFKKLSANLKEIRLADQSASAEVNSFRFEEASGFSLSEFAMNLNLDDQSLSLEDIQLAINRSALSGRLSLGYSSLANLISKPEQSSFDLRLDAPKISVMDAYYFQPSLREDSLFQIVDDKPFSASMDVEGSAKMLQIGLAELSWGQTSFLASGKVIEVMNVDSLRFDFPQIELSSGRASLLPFVSEKELGIQLPENVKLVGRASGMLNELGMEFDLESSMGDIALLASYGDAEELTFSTKIDAKALQLNRLLQNPDLDTVYFSLDAKGSGSQWYEINAEIEARFDSLRLYENDYSGLQISGNLEKGSGSIRSDLNSKNLRYDLLAEVDLDSVNTTASLKLDLIGADFGAMGLTGSNTRAQGLLEASFEGNLEEYQASASISKTTVVHELEPYPVGDILMNAFVKNDTTSVDLESEPLVGFIQSNANPGKFSEALIHYFNQYFAIEDTIRTPGDVILNLNFSIREDPLLTEILLPGLMQLDRSSIRANFSEANQSLIANVDFPFVNYAGAEIDSLGIQVDSDRDGFDFQFGFAALNTGPVAMDKTLISGNLEDALLLLDLQFFDEKKILTHIATKATFLEDSVKVTFVPDDLILDRKAWAVPASNQLVYANEELSFRDMSFTSGRQKVQLTDQLDSLERPHVAAIFDSFSLDNLTSFLNPEKVIANGDVQGSLIVQRPFGALGILGDLTIDSLAVMETHLGTLSLEAVAETLGNYVLDAELSGAGIDLLVAGEFQSDEESATFDLDLDLNQLQLEILQTLLPEDILQAGGIVQGQIKAKGSTADPVYEGGLSFKDASITPAIVGTKYLFTDEKVRLDNAGIYLSDFTVRDESQNTFAVDGEIGTENLVNPTFDLQVTAEKFMAINSTNEESELFFGKGTIDADISVTGDLLLPVVRGTLAVKDQTDLTFIIPESQAALVERQGVVIFVNKENPDNILTRNDEEISNTFSGYDIKLLLEVDPTARFKIIIDPSSGDNLALTASGELDLAVDPIGRTSLSGRLEVERGHYELSLYSLVNRRFEIEKGSTIIWNGDPLDANMDITASYEVRTAPAPLMASQLTGSGDATQSQYGKRLDFLVFLYLDGELLQPEISFGLDMPENERGEFGGNVYAQVQQISDQEGELNRQVFSLLVLNRFFPSGGSDGSGGGTEAIARNSVSQLLSDQLNNFSNQLFGDSGFEVGFEVDSYTQGAGGQAQTELNVSAQQTLFDDRLTVQVGSQFDVEGNSQETQDAGAILGNISIEYTLTEDGRFLIRAFRKNQFESIIDGQLMITGLGVVFNREFNEFKNLWKRPFNPELELKSNPIDELDNNSEEKNKSPEQTQKNEN
ncbi:translocation/assembly module TamB domain-containing protein [Algoriphagus namhaensis]